MNLQKLKVNRRGFALGAAGLMATTALSISGTAHAFMPESPIAPQEGMHFVITNLYPKKNEKAIIKDTNNKNRMALYKNPEDLENDKYIEVNGMALMVFQLCHGNRKFDKIVSTIAAFYEVNEYEFQEKVYNYLNFLYEQGFITFGSPEALSETEKKKGRGGHFIAKEDKTIRVFFKSKGKSAIKF